MKYHIAIIFMSIAALTQADVKHEKLRAIIGMFLNESFQYKANCVEESNVSEEAIDKFWNHDYSGENDQNLKCYLRCAYLKTNLIDEKGVLQLDNLMKQNGFLQEVVTTSPDLLPKVNEYCKEPKSTDLCQAAYETTQCGFKWVPELSNLAQQISKTMVKCKLGTQFD